MKSSLPEQTIEALVHGDHGAPLEVLGMHARPKKGGVVVRTLNIFAESVEVVAVESGVATPMKRRHANGFFEAEFPKQEAFTYRLSVTEKGQAAVEIEDPYRFPCQTGDVDMYLYGEGNHFRTYEKMGAHAMEIDGVAGVHFCIWAPNARRVSLTCEQNRWDGRQHPLHKLGDIGLWEVFMPGMTVGELYKFEVKFADGTISEKADPYAFATELRPNTAAMVWNNHAYEWQDADWMARRRKTDWMAEAISVYEVHLGSWRKKDGEDGERVWLSYRELAEEMIPYVKEMGFTHIELLPVTEHPFDGSWGYQPLGYFAPTSRFGTPDDLKHFIDCCHAEDIGVILDWVPAHFPKDLHGLCRFDGTHLYEHEDPRLGEHMDWGTLIFNYGRNEVRSFLLSSAMYWADVFHIDGIRVDAVASMLYLDYSREEGQWIPNKHGGRENLEAVEFLKQFNIEIHQEYPGILTFAEESTAWSGVSRPTYVGGLGFGFKWNMGWMNDTLRYFSMDPIYRKYHHSGITFSMLYAFSENFILPFSHDEVVHGKKSMLGKMPGDCWQQFANLRLLYAYLFAHPGKKLLFMGSEFAQGMEWDDAGELHWYLLDTPLHQQMKTCVKDLNRVYRDNPALHRQDFSWEGFSWINANDSDQSLLSFLRKSPEDGDEVVCVFNNTPTPRHAYRIGVPRCGSYQEVFNTDSEFYGGSNVGNGAGLASEPMPWNDFPNSIEIDVPPLGAIFLKPL